MIGPKNRGALGVISQMGWSQDVEPQDLALGPGQSHMAMQNNLLMDINGGYCNSESDL